MKFDLITINEPTFSVSMYILGPTIFWKKKTTFLNKTEEYTTKLELPPIYELTKQNLSIIVEISLVFGFGLKIVTKE